MCYLFNSEFRQTNRNKSIHKNGWVFFSYDAFLWLKMDIHRNGQVLNSANVYVFIPMVLFYD